MIKFNTSKRYAIIRLINDYIDLYESFTYTNVTKYIDTLQGKIQYNSEVIYLSSGVTKLCLIFPNEKYVIKIPLMGDLNHKQSKKYRKEIKCGNYTPIYEKTFNYCEIETVNYLKAEEEGLEDFFAKEEKIMEYRGIPIYVQERIQVIYCDSTSYSMKPKEDVMGYESEWGEEMNNFFSDLLEAAGEDKFQQIIDFIEWNGINDLHDENVGYNYEGLPIFFDYSGF